MKKGRERRMDGIRGTGWQGMGQFVQHMKMNIQRVGGGRHEGWTEGGAEREDSWLVLTPVIALMYNLT